MNVGRYSIDLSRPLTVKSLGVEVVGDRSLKIVPTIRYTGDESRLPPPDTSTNESLRYEIDIFVGQSPLARHVPVHFDKNHQTHRLIREIGPLGPRFGDKTTVRVLDETATVSLSPYQDPEPKPEPEPEPIDVENTAELWDAIEAGKPVSDRYDVTGDGKVTTADAHKIRSDSSLWERFFGSSDSSSGTDDQDNSGSSDSSSGSDDQDNSGSSGPANPDYDTMDITTSQELFAAIQADRDLPGRYDLNDDGRITVSDVQYADQNPGVWDSLGSSNDPTDSSPDEPTSGSGSETPTSPAPSPDEPTSGSGSETPTSPDEYLPDWAGWTPMPEADPDSPSGSSDSSGRPTIAGYDRQMILLAAGATAMIAWGASR